LEKTEFLAPLPLCARVAETYKRRTRAGRRVSASAFSLNKKKFW